MNKKVLKSIFILIIMLFCMLYATTVLAAGNFTLSKSSATITEGKSTTFSINGSGATGRVDITSSNTSVATVSSSNEWLEGDSKTITITAKKTGTATITVTGTVADDEGAEAAITKTVKVTVKAKETTTTTTDKNTNTTVNNTNTTNTNTTNKDTTTTKTKSSNAYLSTLGVTPKEYDFSGFSKTKTSYSVTIPSDVDTLKVIAKPADSNATVKVSGNSGFEVGSNNKITIKVTAEDGKTNKTYTIKVTKLATDEEQPGNLIEDEPEIYLTSLEIEGLEISPKFEKDVYTYTATLSDSKINELKVNAKSNNEKANVEISGNTEIVEGENVINILVTHNESTKKVVYQITVTKEANDLVTTTQTEETSNTDLVGTIKKYIKIIVGVVLLIIIAIIVLIILLKKENKKIRNEDMDDEDEYNVYKNDINEFENRDNDSENFIESLYRQRNGDLYNEEELSEQYKETLEEINKQTDDIFRDKVKGQTVEYDSIEFEKENLLEGRRKRRGKGKHSM